MCNMRNKALGKLVSFVLALVMLLSCGIFSGVSAEEEKTTYAEIVFGDKVTATGATAYGYNVTTVRQGRTGVVLNSASTAEFVWFNIDNDVLYDIPEDTPIDITVEYFDEGNGFIALTYDSHNPTPGWGSLANNEYFKDGDDAAYMQDTMQWKSHTFHVEDLKAADRMNITDFRVGIWTPTLSASPEAVIVGAIKVQESEFKTPVKVLERGFEHKGNILSADEEPALNVGLYNKAETPIGVKVTGTVYDSYGRVLEELRAVEDEIEGKTEAAYKIEVANPKTYGLYTIKGQTSVWYKDKPDNVITEDYTVQFSVSYIHEDGVSDFGSQLELAGKGHGDPESVAEIYRRSGMTYIRDTVGSLADLPAKIEKWKIMRENGVNVIGVMFNFGLTSSWNALPKTDDEIAAWADCAAQAAEKLKGVVDILEIWNEANIAAFNSNEATPEDYAKLCIAAYPKMKAANPNVTVLGVGATSLGDCSADSEFIRGVFEAGAFDYMDVISIHPYDWSGMLREERFIGSARTIQDIMKDFGQPKPIWITEFGISTYTGGNGLGYTRKEQYQNLILARAISKAYGLYEKYIFYEFADGRDREEVEDNWGFVNFWEDIGELNAYAAKESYVAMAAFNHLITPESELVGTIDGDRVYMFNYKNPELNKNVLYMQTGEGEVHKKSISLGCTSVDVYDAYGNKKATLKSDDGVYTFVADHEPVYVTGNFTDFAEKEYAPKIWAEDVSLDGVSNDIIGFKLTADTDRELVISADAGIEVVDNKGFVNGEAILNVRVPSDGSDEKCFFVTVSDTEGNVLYCEEFSISITPPIDVETTAERTNDVGDNYWRVRSVIKNLSSNVSVSGTFKVTNPEDVAVLNSVRDFKIAPGDSITFISRLPEKVSKSEINFAAEVELDTGFKQTFSKNINFTTVRYAQSKPVIDGVLSNREWTGSWICADSPEDVQLVRDIWQGVSDSSFNGTMMWDEENIYFVGVAVDDVHYIAQNGGINNMWSVDSFQIGFDDRETINPVSKGEFTEIGIGEIPGKGAKMNRTKTLYDLPTGEVGNCDVAIKRYDTYTVYECRIPWDELFYKDYVFNPDAPFRMSVLLNDHDGTKRGYIEYTSGIGTSKNVEMFGDVTFLK